MTNEDQNKPLPTWMWVGITVLFTFIGMLLMNLWNLSEKKLDRALGEHPTVTPMLEFNGYDNVLFDMTIQFRHPGQTTNYHTVQFDNLSYIYMGVKENGK
jgi:hypothetical protein